MSKDHARANLSNLLKDVIKRTNLENSSDTISTRIQIVEQGTLIIYNIS